MNLPSNGPNRKATQMLKNKSFSNTQNVSIGDLADSPHPADILANDEPGLTTRELVEKNN